MPEIIDMYLEGDHWVGRGGQPAEVVCMHITDGETVSGAISHWNRPDIDASTHYIVDKDGRIYRTVRESDVAWANGVVNLPDLTNPLIAGWVARGVNPNRRTLGVEIVGKPGRPLPAAQWASVIWLVGDICARLGIVQDRTHVIGHSQIDRVDRGRCPSLTLGQWAELTPAEGRGEPVVTAEDAALEREYQREAGRLGVKRAKARLTRPYYTGDILLTQRGVVGQDALITSAIRERLMDDLITLLEAQGDLRRY